MNADEWLKKVANEVQRRLPNAYVDDVFEGTLTICRGRAAVSVAATANGAVAMGSLDRTEEGPWSADRVAHGDALTFPLSEASTVDAAEMIVGLLR